MPACSRPCVWIAFILLLTACMPIATQTALRPQTIPPEGIYQPEQVVVRRNIDPAGFYEFAAAGRPEYPRAAVAEIAYCRASIFALQEGYSGWFIKDEVETVTPLMRQVSVIVGFYLGEKPLFVTNENETDWCGWRSQAIDQCYTPPY